MVDIAKRRIRNARWNREHPEANRAAQQRWRDLHYVPHGDRTCKPYTRGPCGLKALLGMPQSMTTREYVSILKVEAGCKDCGYDDCPEALEYDHVGVKIGCISEIKRLRKILEEIPKCDVVCANCHRVRTIKRRAHAKIGVTS